MHPIRRGPSLWKLLLLHPKDGDLNIPADSRHRKYTLPKLKPIKNGSYKANVPKEAYVVPEPETTPLPAPLFFVAKRYDTAIDHLDLWNYNKFCPDYASPTEYQLYMALSGFVNIYRDLGKTFTPYRKRRQVILDIVQPLRGIGNILGATVLAIVVIPYLLFIITGIDLLWRFIKLQRGGYKNAKEMWAAAGEHLLLSVIAPIIDVIGSALHGLFQVAFSPINYFLRMPLRGMLYLYNRKAIQNAKVEEGKSYRELVARGETLIQQLHTDSKNPQEKSRLATHLLWVCYRLRTKFYIGQHKHELKTDMPNENANKLKKLWDYADSKEDAAWIHGTSSGETNIPSGLRQMIEFSRRETKNQKLETLDPVRAPNLCALATQSEDVILHNTELLESYFSLFKFTSKINEPETAPVDRANQVYIFASDTLTTSQALSAAPSPAVQSPFFDTMF